jgi:hypothetical protein
MPSKVSLSKMTAGDSTSARSWLISRRAGMIQCLAWLPDVIFFREASAKSSMVPSNQVVRTGAFGT